MTSPGGPTESNRPVRGPARTGIVAFAATGALALGGTAATLAAFRWLRPDLFAFAPRLLDRTLGSLAAAGMLVAASCGAVAALCAVASRRRIACAMIITASVFGAGVLVVRGIETPTARRNAGFVTPNTGTRVAAAPAAAGPAHLADAGHGKTIFFGTCAACHGPELTGWRGQGAHLRESDFVRSKSDADLLAFVKIGRQPFDPASKLHLAMPARGGNPALKDGDLVDAIAFIREVVKAAPAATAAAGGAPGSPAKAASGAGTAPPVSGDQPFMLDGRLWLPHSVIPAASAGPDGVRAATVALQVPGARARSSGIVKEFFALVLFTNVLQAFYLACGIALAGVAVAGVLRGRWSMQAIALVAGYWVVVGALCLLTAPLLYLAG